MDYSWKLQANLSTEVPVVQMVWSKVHKAHQPRCYWNALSCDMQNTLSTGDLDVLFHLTQQTDSIHFISIKTITVCIKPLYILHVFVTNRRFDLPTLLNQDTKLYWKSASCVVAHLTRKQNYFAWERILPAALVNGKSYTKLSYIWPTPCWLLTTALNNSALTDQEISHIVSSLLLRSKYVSNSISERQIGKQSVNSWKEMFSVAVLTVNSWCPVVTKTVEQSPGCATETRDDTAHFQATTQGLSVPHRCADEQKKHPPPPRAVVVFLVILALDTKLPAYLW